MNHTSPSKPETVKSHNQSSAGYSVTFRLQLLNKPGNLAKVLDKIGKKGANISEVSLIESNFNFTLRDITVKCQNEFHSNQVVEELKAIPDVLVVDWYDDTFKMHEGGKLSVESKVFIDHPDKLARAYTPGVGRVSSAIHANPENVYKYTIKSNCIAVVSDGTSVLGLGNIGPEAAIPVMEGKAMAFKQFANLDAFPICLNTQDVEEIIKTVKYISPVFGGINLEDISAPRCFEIEDRLKAELDIPVFHDDQHGTAVVVLASLINALKLVKKDFATIKVVVNGFGASGVACTKMLLEAGIKNIIPCDSKGIIFKGRKDGLNKIKEELLKFTNLQSMEGTLADALKGADVFLGLSKPGSLTREMVKTMAKEPIIFALANPIPEILPDEIMDIAAVVATGRSDYPNQINNVLCFPGIFRGALDAKAKHITDKMKIAAANAIASCVSPDELKSDYIIPGIFDEGKNVAEVVADAVRKVAADNA